jgi:hypothetical protein
MAGAGPGPVWGLPPATEAGADATRAAALRLSRQLVVSEAPMTLLTGPQLWIVFGVLFLVGCAIYVLIFLRDETDFAPYSRHLQEQDYERRHQLDATLATTLDPIRRHAVMGTETRPR